LFCLKEYPEQFHLYRCFRPFKEPEQAHAVDFAFARRNNEKFLKATATLNPIEKSFFKANFPDDLFNWVMKRGKPVEGQEWSLKGYP
jgi:hypothetical protein